MASSLQNWGEIIRTQNLSSDKAMDGISRWLLITRASVFPMTIISGLIGGLLAAGAPGANWLYFALAFSQLLLVLTVAWVVVFGVLKPPLLDPTPRFMKWVSAMAILVGLATMSMPWRLVWHNESPRIEMGDVEGYVVARDEDELFVYAPKEPAGKQHLTIRPNDPRITSLSRTPEYIFGEESCEEGVAE